MQMNLKIAMLQLMPGKTAVDQYRKFDCVMLRTNHLGFSAKMRIVLHPVFKKLDTENF